MAYYEPLSKPPSRGIYVNNKQRIRRVEEDREYEFDEPAPLQRQNSRGISSEQMNDHQHDGNALLQDPLSRRMLSLLTPLIPATSSAGMEIHRINGPLSFIANNSSKIASQQSTFPHPSFQVRSSNDRSTIGNQSQDYAFDCTYDSMGYYQHAHFFSPRKITADEPFHNDNTHANDNVNIGSSSSPPMHQEEYNSMRNQSNQRYAQNAQYGDNVNHQDQRDSLDASSNVYAQNTNTSNYGNANDPFLNAFGSSSTQPSSAAKQSQQQQTHRFGLTYDHPDDPSNTTINRKKKKQKRIIQNATNGDLGTASTATVEQGWAQVGQIASYHSSLDAEQSAGRHDKGNGKDRQQKSKKKKKSKDRPIPDIRTMVRGVETPAIDEIDSANASQQNGQSNYSNSGSTGEVQKLDHNDDAFQPKASRSKKNKRQFPKDPSQRSSSTTSQPSAAAPKFDPIPLETIETFAETYQVNNAGASSEALRSFLQIVKSKKYVAWTMIFHDSMCSTPFLPSTKKYCTPKGAPCTMWNCTCDHQIRAMQASAPLVGAMFVFPMDCEDGSEDSDETDCFLLPLCPIDDPEDGPMDIDAGFERMARWPFLKISCDTSLQERWDTLRKILLDRSLIKVTYQAQVGLMPFHYHRANDVVNMPMNTDENNGSNEILNPNIGYLDLVLPNMWDLRLASWMLTPHGKEEALELENKKTGFSHICPKTKFERPANASSQLQGLIQAKEDLEFLYALYPIIERLLENNGLKDAFCEIESPVQSVLSSMECFGIGFKAKRLLKIQQELESRIERLNIEAKSIVGDDNFMLSSPQQVSQLLFDRMGLRVPTQPNSGSVSKNHDSNQHKSTSEENLKLIQKELKARDGQGIRIIDVVLESRALNKVLSTYIRPYPKLARDENQTHSRKVKRRSKKKSSESKQIQKIHPMWMQTAVRTGRLSCRKPNMQQVPTGSVIPGVYPRNFFTSSSKGSCLFACDYSQNEVRILAHMSNDDALILLFTQPGAIDIYKQMASVTSGKPPTEVSDEERAVSKQVTLAIMYGMGLNTVAKKLGVNKSEAKKFFNSFYGRFRGVKRWMDDTVRFARANKYVTTITGRKR
jgi:DNA polymerase-1